MGRWTRAVELACLSSAIGWFACSSDRPGVADLPPVGGAGRAAEIVPSAGAGASAGRSAAVSGNGSPAGSSSQPAAGASGAPNPPPDAPARPSAPTLAGDIAFSAPSQTFRDVLEVRLSTEIAGAEIRYTTDGTQPSTSSPVYTDALRLTGTTQLRAQAFVAGAASGNLGTAIYIARTFDATSDLPIVVVDGYGGAKPTDKQVFEDAAFMVFEPRDGTASIANLPVIAARSGYHVRGQSSARAPQTPYRVELRNNADQDADYEVLGMPADSDWALIPPYYDRSLVRNPLVYQLGRELGLSAPRVRFAEVYLNYEARPLAESDYLGIYWVTETIKNNRVRLDLAQLDPAEVTLPALTGGYIFKFDQAATEEPRLVCTGSPPISTGFGMGMGMGMGGRAGSGAAPRGTCWSDLEVVDPDPLAPEQAAWLTDYIQQFHDVVQASPIGDYAAFIDVASFVDYLIINELTRNVDAYVRSAFYHKDRGGKLVAGPLWDYNFSLGLGGQNTIDPTGGFQYAGSRNVNDWYPKLMADPAFRSSVQARWVELRGAALSDAAIAARIDELVQPLTAAAERDYAKWHVADILKPNGFIRGPSAPTWQGQVQALREFVRARAAWLDGQLR